MQTWDSDSGLFRSKGCALHALPHHRLHVCFIRMLATYLALNGFCEVSHNAAYLMDNAAREQLNSLKNVHTN